MWFVISEKPITSSGLIYCEELSKKFDKHIYLTRYKLFENCVSLEDVVEKGLEHFIKKL